MRMHGRVRRRMSMEAVKWALRLWESLDTPVSLSLAILLRNGEYEQVIRKTCNPSDYADPLSFFLDYQAVKALSKYPYLDTGIDRRRQAIDSFLAAEVQCAQTNTRIRNQNHPQRVVSPSEDVRKVFFLATRKIASILGPVPSLEQLDFRFGPGASLGVRGDTSAYKKLTSPLECSFASSQICSDFLSEFPGWLPEGATPVLQVSGSELSFVPKDAKTDRPICIEPLLNGLMQKGIGSFIRDRLLHHGVNLRQQEINQELARRAYDDRLATVDFKSASDTIAYMLVLDLLPIDWVEFLDISRSPSYSMEGRWYDFHKWSSMGNAYTFELETLIFYALASCSCVVAGVPFSTGENLHVYGDDVVIPRAAYDLFHEVSAWSGFTINSEKSYVDGNFYESCGADWFQGHNVRPLLLKKRISTLQDAYYVTNGTLAIAAKVQSLRGWHDDDFIRRRVDSLRGLHGWCVGCIPSHLRCLVPPGSGHHGLYCEFDLAVPRKHESWCGFWYHGWYPDPAKVALPEWPISYALYWAGSGTPRGWWDDVSETQHSSHYIPRPKFTRLKRRKAFHFGAWGSMQVTWLDATIRLVQKKEPSTSKRKRK